MKLPKLSFGKIGRSAVCIAIVVVIFSVYVLQLVQWQLVQGAEFERIARSSRTDAMELDPARGEILDRNGVVLAGNKTAYAVVYDAMEMVERNVTILKVLDILIKQEEIWRDRLPITIDGEGNYQFIEGKEEEITTLKSADMLNLADYASADDCMVALMERYDCAGYSKEDTRNVASVRYSMTRDGFSPANSYVFANSISPETVGIFSQMEKELPGIHVRVAVSRYYGDDGALAPHVVGNVAGIQPGQYEKAVENGTAYDEETNPSGYKMNDTRGLEGIESAFEADLRGKRGKKSVYTDDTGKVETAVVNVPPEEGNTVHLTLDANLQRVANQSLKENIESNTAAKECEAGAAVVLDVKDFGVLASATYPTYDMNRYTTDEKYTSEMLTAEGGPMYNRALEGIFTPGSVFKPMVALAALQEGSASAATTEYCSGWFNYYDLKLKCTEVHENVNVYSAMSGSCNVYFCNMGLDLRIARMDAYAEYFALGTKTGVELPEAEGIMSSPKEYEERHSNATWTDGLTAQTAIGQCDNMFSPVQLATYCATIANSGVRLRTHFLKEVTNYTGSEVVRQYESEVMSDAGLTSDVLGVVRESMRQVASSGTASTIFGNYPVSIAAKTGTAEISGEDEPNLTFIAYAPADNPEIAVAVVMEKGNKGPYAQKVAKDILDQYFGYIVMDEEGNRFDKEGNKVDKDGKVLLTKEQVEAEKAYAEAMKRNEEEGNSPTPEATPVPSATPSPRDEGIPEVPFTGETPSPSPDPGSTPVPGASPTPTPSATVKPNSPYWKGG